MSITDVPKSVTLPPLSKERHREAAKYLKWLDEMHPIIDRSVGDYRIHSVKCGVCGNDEDRQDYYWRFLLQGPPVSDISLCRACIIDAYNGFKRGDKQRVKENWRGHIKRIFMALWKKDNKSQSD